MFPVYFTHKLELKLIVKTSVNVFMDCALTHLCISRNTSTETWKHAPLCRQQLHIIQNCSLKNT